MIQLLKGFALSLICITSLNHIGYSQSVYKIEEGKDVEMKLRGTSTLHNWEMNASRVKGEAQFDTQEGNKLTAVKSLSFALVVEDLKSDNKGLDKNAYKALKSEEYKDIQYKLISAVVSPERVGKQLLKTHGNLTIAGITKEIDIDVYCVVNADETIKCTGFYKLKMTDYQVKPPSFMLGAMKTGDNVALDFSIVYLR